MLGRLAVKWISSHSYLLEPIVQIPLEAPVIRWKLVSNPDITTHPLPPSRQPLSPPAHDIDAANSQADLPLDQPSLSVSQNDVHIIMAAAVVLQVPNFG